MDLSNYLIIIYVLFFVIALGFAVVINLLLLKLSKELQTGGLDADLEHLKQVRWQNQAKPAMGGVGFFILFLLSVSSYFMLPFHVEAFFGRELFALLGACTLGFLIGLYDDSFNAQPLIKFGAQFVCGLFLVAMGIHIPLTPYTWFNYSFTILWVVGIMNSINMLDNMDGITASVSLSIIMAALMLLLLSNQAASIYFIICIGVAAAMVGFLFFNWSPSKMYMGDSGSQFLGAFLAYLSIVLMWKYRDASSGVIAIKQFLVPMILFIVPLIDTITVCIRRISQGKSPFVGGRDHTTHHLAFNGISDGIVAAILFMISLASIIITYFLVTNFHNWNLSKSLIVIGYFVTLFIIMQMLYERGKRQLDAKKSGDTPPQ